MTTLARRERHALCDLVLALGPTAPTLLDGWDATDLVTHLLVREHSPLGAAGLLVPPLSGLTDRAMARRRRQDPAALVERLREPGATPYALPGVEVLANTLEYLVHHEDLRRAQPGWEPRRLDPVDLDLVWRLVSGMGRLLVRPAGVPVRAVRSDTGAAVTLRRGPDPVVVTGPVVELTLFLFGRDAVRDVVLDGPPDAVTTLREADLGL
ncbi:TIGR03085 family metal-binding protein [Nocardioides dongkuii]|uniref:TIGR03085 family metal-binding protein n=1 Tax=Nocardioides dongkuii TaxID=2760089 RepID=UPI0015FA2F65|nr:TIGR03085 family metal-binding protein [Nocardioides dongkuii]